MSKAEYDDDYYGYTLTCKECGKQFWVSCLTLYTYKAKNHVDYFCSYTCYRKGTSKLNDKLD